MSGAQTGIDQDHSAEWLFTTGATDPWIFGGGNFVMKDGPQTGPYSVTLSLYEGASDMSALLASLTYTNSQFEAVHGGNSQSFAPTAFPFENGGVLLQAGTTYYVKLSSDAPAEQSRAYFLKGADSAVFRTADGNALLSADPIRGENLISQPEPSSWLLGASAIAALAWLRRRGRAGARTAARRALNPR